MIHKISENINTNYSALTGFRTLLIYQLLMEGPKSMQEIKDFLYDVENRDNKISDDTIRNYLNSLRENNCVITKATKLTGNKFILRTHPLEFRLSENQINALKRIFNKINDDESIIDLEKFEILILKLISLVNNQETKDILIGLIIINKYNKDIYKQVSYCCQNNLCATFYYESSRYGKQEMEMVCTRLLLRSKKLYIEGYNTKYKSYSSLLLSRVIRIESIKKYDSSFIDFEGGIICEIYDKDYIPKFGETIIDEFEDKIIIKINDLNEFMAFQKILNKGDSCKILQPKSLEDKIKKTITEMRKIYGCS